MDLNDKIIIYRSEDGETQLEVRIDQETVWLNAYQIAELFGRDSKTIRKHIANAIKEELAGEVVVANFATTTEHGAIKGKSQTHDVRFYNLDVIISVGYRVKSKKGVDFRRWANKVLKEYLIKGYAVNKALTEQRYTELIIGQSIAATLFLWFMAGNGILYNPDGTKRIADNTLVALTLMIAESRTEEKDVMVKVVVNLINKNNYE